VDSATRPAKRFKAPVPEEGRGLLPFQDACTYYNGQPARMRQIYLSGRARYKRYGTDIYIEPGLDLSRYTAGYELDDE
jgi:hypothetical protein